MAQSGLRRVPSGDGFSLTVINCTRRRSTPPNVSDRYRPKIVVVDYGAGNLRSVTRAVALAGADVLLSEHSEAIRDADAIVVPGDGAARSAMDGLEERGLIGPIRDYVASGRPFLGVCLGMQVLMTWSDEDGGTPCLGIVPGRVVRLSTELKIPHIGWNQVEQRRGDPLLAGIADGEDFYFVHSYVAVPDNPAEVIGVTTYGESFVSVIRRGNVVATQFHPEKSADAGLQMYRNFVSVVAGDSAARHQVAHELV
jgi:glutamine amidotransferase